MQASLVGSFALEGERRDGPRLLLASISSATDGPRKGGLRLPRLEAVEGLRASVTRLAPGPGSAAGPRSHKLPPAPDLRQLPKVAAAAGGLLVAAVSQAAQRLASVRPGRGSQTLPFYQSFKLPWNVGARTGSRRWVLARRLNAGEMAGRPSWEALFESGPWQRQIAAS